MESSNLELIIASLIGLLIWSGILYLIIKSASKSDVAINELRIQTRLLMKMAEKQGVGGTEIRACFKPMPLPDEK